jgi:hypothetical protein
VQPARPAAAGAELRRRCSAATSGREGTALSPEHLAFLAPRLLGAAGTRLLALSAALPPAATAELVAAGATFRQAWIGSAASKLTTAGPRRGPATAAFEVRTSRR